jgi:hypothetical protein
MLVVWDAINRRVQWRRTYIDVDPSVAASAPTTARQPNTAPGSIFPETRQSLSPIREQSHVHLHQGLRVPRSLHLIRRIPLLP